MCDMIGHQLLIKVRFRMHEEIYTTFYVDAIILQWQNSALV